MSPQGRLCDEDRRVQSLHDMHLTEREPEPAIVASVEATSEALGCPIASVTLIDQEEEIFLAAVGVERCTAPREQAFCAHTIASEEILVVEDAQLDERFAGNPQVVERGIRFYAGIALHSPDGQRIGALSVRDRRPRTLSEQQRQVLLRMAMIVESQLIACADRWKRVQTQLLLNGVMKSSQDAVLLLKPVYDDKREVCDFQITSASSAAESVLNQSCSALRQQMLSRVLCNNAGSDIMPRLLEVFSTGRAAQFESNCWAGDHQVWHHVSVARWHDGLAMTVHDITEHKHTASQLDDVFAMSLDLMCVIDSRMRYVRVNHAFERLLGVPDGSLPGRSWLQCVDKQDVDRTRQLISKVFAGQAITMFENQLVDHLGQRHWIQWRAQLLGDGRSIFAIGRDVTESRQTQQLLKQSERFARSIIDTLSESIAIIDSSGMILNVNQTWRDFSQANNGDPAKMCEGANYLNVCHHAAEAGDADAAVILQGIKGVLFGSMESFEHTYRCDSPNSPRWFVVTVNHLEYDHRRCAVVSHHDVTQRKLAETKLQLAMLHLDRQAAVVANSLDGICKCSPDGRLLYVNHAGRVLVGLTDTEPLPEDLYQCVPGEMRQLLEQTVIATASKKGRWTGELAVIHLKTGKQIPVRVSAFAIPKSDGEGIDCLAAIYHDISKEKQAQEELKQARIAAENAHRERSEFIAAMGHKIRSPMTAILGYTDLLMEPHLSPADRSNHLQVIRRSGRQLLGMLNDLLDLSNIEAGHMTLTAQPITTATLLDQILTEMRPFAEEKNLELSVHCDGRIPRQFTGDPVRIRQIITHLISNGIEFTSVGGVRVGIDTTAKDDRLILRFAVTDTGIGLSADQAATIFQPFRNIDNTTSRVHTRSGLTLVISQKLAQLMSGVITVQSQLGQGSTFTLSLDVGPVSKHELTHLPLSCTAGRGGDATLPHLMKHDLSKQAGRILVAEDGIDNQRLISFYLQRMGLTIDLAGNGKQAVERASNAAKSGESYRLILMDLQMPEMDGLQTTALLRQSGYAGPIVALTAHASIGDRERCLAGGCDDYIPKPIDRNRLEQVVARWLRATEQIVGNC